MADIEKLAGYIDALVAEKERVNGSLSIAQAQKIAMLADCIKASTTAYFLKIRLRN